MTQSFRENTHPCRTCNSDSPIAPGAWQVTNSIPSLSECYDEGENDPGTISTCELTWLSLADKWLSVTSVLERVVLREKPQVSTLLSLTLYLDNNPHCLLPVLATEAHTAGANEPILTAEGKKESLRWLRKMARSLRKESNTYEASPTEEPYGQEAGFIFCLPLLWRRWWWGCIPSVPGTGKPNSTSLSPGPPAC